MAAVTICSDFGAQKIKSDTGPITSWQIEGERVELMIDFLFFGSKITTDVDCSHELEDANFFAGKL